MGFTSITTLFTNNKLGIVQNFNNLQNNLCGPSSEFYILFFLRHVNIYKRISFRLTPKAIGKASPTPEHGTTSQIAYTTIKRHTYAFDIILYIHLSNSLLHNINSTIVVDDCSHSISPAIPHPHPICPNRPSALMRMSPSESPTQQKSNEAPNSKSRATA